MDAGARAASRYRDTTNATGILSEADRDLRILTEETAVHGLAKRTRKRPGGTRRRDLGGERDPGPARSVHDGSIPESTRGSDLAPATRHAGAFDSGGETVGPNPGVAADRDTG